MVRSYAQKLSSLTWEAKSHADYVSDADRHSEETIRTIVAGRHADAFVLGEELSPHAAMERVARDLVFVVDPLDGTTNFLHGFPWYAVSVAALVDGALTAGAILNAATGELFTAVAGGGARRSGAAIRVSEIRDPARALIGTGFPFKERDQVATYTPGFANVMRQTAGVRRAGAAALDLADVACGRFDAFWELSLAPWDIAAGILLVREAGGVATTLAGEEAKVQHTSLVAGGRAMHSWLMTVLAGS